MIRFAFQLRPLADVAPWGKDDDPTLHWFGLTDGWYWIEADGHELLRYNKPDLDLPYVDYYLARYWEDLIQLAGVLTEAVPDDIIAFISSDVNFLAAWPEDVEWPDDEATDAALTASSDHILDFGYIRNPPDVKCWRHRTDGDDLVTFLWRSEPDDGIAFTGPPIMEITMPTVEFFNAVSDLHHRLIEAMEDRVRELERNGAPADINIDVTHLRTEHNDRATWLHQRLQAAHHTDWNLVRSGIRTLTNPPMRKDHP